MGEAYSWVQAAASAVPSRNPCMIDLGRELALSQRAEILIAACFTSRGHRLPESPFAKLGFYPVLGPVYSNDLLQHHPD